MKITKDKNRIKILILMLLATFFCICFVYMTAQSSAIQYDINQINSQITNSEWTQRNLEAKIKGANTLSSLEKEAKDMGLVYASFDDTIYLETEAEEDNVHDLALVMREAAHR